MQMKHIDRAQQRASSSGFGLSNAMIYTKLAADVIAIITVRRVTFFRLPAATTTRCTRYTYVQVFLRPFSDPNSGLARIPSHIFESYFEVWMDDHDGRDWAYFIYARMFCWGDDSIELVDAELCVIQVERFLDRPTLYVPINQSRFTELFVAGNSNAYFFNFEITCCGG